MNVRKQSGGVGWKITKVVLDHNHPPLNSTLMAFKNRNKGLTTDMKDFVRTLADTHIPPEDVLMCFRRKYPTAPLITSQDVKNMRSPSGGGSQDAANLLDKLLHLQQHDNRWLVK